MSSSTASWLADLNAQVQLRNATELAPSKALLLSYAALHRHALAQQDLAADRTRLQADNERLLARVRELERVAADSSIRSNREVTLETRRDELQAKLQHYIEKENEYYRGLAELRECTTRAAVAESRAAVAEADVEKRSAELTLVKKEYVALSDENTAMRARLSDADAALLDAKTITLKLAQLQQRVKELEAEVARLRNELEQRGVHVDSANDDSPLSARGSQWGRAGDGSGGAAAAAATEQESRQPTSFPRRAARVMESAHGDAILQCVCSGEGTRQAFTAGSDKLLRAWDCSTGEEKRRFSSGSSLALSLDSTSHYLLAGCVDKTVRFWDTHTLRVLELVGHSEKVVSVALSATAQHGFTASSDSTIKLWDIRRRASLRTLMCQSTSNDLTVAGDSIFSAHYNGSLTVWDRRTAARSCEVPKAHQRIATCVRITHDGRLCVSLGKDNTISVRDTRIMATTLRTIAPPQLVVGMTWTRLALSPDSRVVAVGSSRGQIIFASLEKSADASIIAAFPFLQDGERSGEGDGVLQVLEKGGHARDAPVHCVAWGAEANAPLVSIGEDRRVVVWQ